MALRTHFFAPLRRFLDLAFWRLCSSGFSSFFSLPASTCTNKFFFLSRGVLTWAAKFTKCPVCVASSCVGTTTMTLGQQCPGVLLRSARAIAVSVNDGSAYASVFPLPVSAISAQCWPVSSAGIACLCVSVGIWKPFRSKASAVCGCIPSRANSRVWFGVFSTVARAWNSRS